MSSQGWVDLSPVAPNGLGSSQAAAGGSSVALLCEGAGGPMVCLTWPSTQAWEASLRVPQHCLSESLAQPGQGASCTAPQRQRSSRLCQQQGPQSNSNLQPCNPISLCFFFLWGHFNFKRPTFCSRDACPLGCISLEQAAAIPSHLSFKVVRYKCRGPRFCPASIPCTQRFRTKLPEEDQGGSQKIAVPRLGLETPFSCFGDRGVSVNVSKGRSLLCSQALRWEVERSVPWSGCDISQPAVLSCSWWKKLWLGIFPSSHLTTRSCCLTAQQACSTFATQKCLCFTDVVWAQKPGPAPTITRDAPTGSGCFGSSPWGTGKAERFSERFQYCRGFPSTQEQFLKPPAHQTLSIEL